VVHDGAGKWSSDETEGYANRGPSGHKHDDVNTIINFTDEGRMWLVDHTYGSARSIKDHSGIYIVRDGQVGYRVREARLLDFEQGDDLSICRSVVAGFSGADWQRTIFWRRGEWFLVTDRVTANVPGDYQVRCSFRGLGEAELRGDTMRLTQDGRYCDITTDGRGALDIEDCVFPSQNHWDMFYPWADGVARVFQQDKSAHLEPGEAITFTTLIRAGASEADLDRITLLPCSPDDALVSGPAGEVLCSVGATPDTSVAQERLALARAEAPDYAATRDGETQAEPFGLKITTLDLHTQVADMTAADLDGDGADEWLVAGAEGASGFAQDGTLLWRFETEAPCRTLTAGDLDGDGRPEVAVGCEDTNLYLLDADGAEWWRFACKGITASIGMPPVPDMIRITGANWVHCLDAAGQVKWERYLRPSRGRICGDFAQGEVVDLEGDGTSETLALFMDSYHKAVLYDAAGQVVMPRDWDENHNYGVNMPLAKCLLLADLRGDGGLQFVVGGDQRLQVYWLRGREPGEFSVRKSGCFVDMALTPVGGETPFLHAANDMGAVVTFRNTQPRDDHIILLDIAWSRAVGEKISRLWAGEVGGQATLLVGTRSGAVHALDPTSGEPVGLAAPTGSEVVRFVLQGDTIVAAHADGVLRRLTLAR
jgi:outer membrane protein assembly factor BamB